MEIWNPYKFTNAEAVVTMLMLLVLLVVLIGMKYASDQYKRRMIFLPLLLFWIFTILSATYFGRLETASSKLKLELFWTFRTAWTEHKGSYWFLIIGNILLFIPLGFLLPLVSKRFENCLITTFIGAMMSFCIEVVQYVSRTGLCESDDLFHNTWGTFTGYQFFVVYSHLLGRRYGGRCMGKDSNNGLWRWSLAYLLGICLIFAVMLLLNKPDWKGIFY